MKSVLGFRQALYAGFSAAGPSRPVSRLPRLLAPQIRPSDQRALHCTRPVGAAGSDGFADAPEGYSRPRSSKSRGAWYKSPTTIVLGFIPIFTFSLGYWQIQRLEWKLNLIEELEDKLSREPLRLPKNINLDVLSDFDFRLVAIRGRFDHSKTMFLGPRVRDGTLGYHAVTPFSRAEGGGMVLVNRGFVADKELVGKDADRRLKDNAMPAGETEFVALLPRVYPPNAFTPANEPAKNIWFHANPAQMAEWASQQSGVQPLSLQDTTDSYTPSAGVAESVRDMLGSKSQSASDAQRVLPVYLEEVFDGHAGDAAMRISQGIPLGREATIELRNQHAVYAATWFSLSAATTVMFGLLLRRGRG